MKYLQEYIEFFSSIDDPLERLDDLEVQLEGLEIVQIKSMEITNWVLSQKMNFSPKPRR